MEALDGASIGLAPEQQEKVAQIFRKCDEDKDGVLRKEELMAFMRAVNPCVDWTETQWRLIVDEVSERYRSLWKSGLTQRGLEKTYEDGYGDVDNDYETLFWAEQEHPQDYWQDADEDFWEDPVSSPDRVNASPAISPAKEAAQHAVAHAATLPQQPAVHGADNVSAAEPEHDAEAKAEAEPEEAQASEQPQPASEAAQRALQQDGLDVSGKLSAAEPLPQATADDKLTQHQDGSHVEELLGAADPGQHLLAGEDLKKQPSDVPAAYPMIVHAGAVPRPPSRQTSSEFLASIAGTPQSMRPAASAAVRGALEQPEGFTAGVQRSPAQPIIRAQPAQHLDASVSIDSPAQVPPGRESGETAAPQRNSEPATPGASPLPAFIPTKSAAEDTAQTEEAESAQSVMSEASPAPGAQPVAQATATRPGGGAQPAITTSLAGEAAGAAGLAVSASAQADTNVSGPAALSNIRTSLLPGSMARMLADSTSEAGQSGTPASHRISDVGSEEADEPVTPPADRLADASSMSRPPSPSAGHLTPRALSRNSSGQGSPGWGILKVLSERSELAAQRNSGSPAADAVSMLGSGKAWAGSRLAMQTSAGTDAAEVAADSALGGAIAEEPDLKEGQMSVQAKAPNSVQEQAQPAAEDEHSAASAAAVGRAPFEAQQTGQGVTPDEARVARSIQEEAGATAQNKDCAKSAHAASDTCAVEPGSAMMLNVAMEARSIQGAAEAPSHDKNYAESAAAVGEAALMEHQTEEALTMPGAASQGPSMLEKAGAPAQKEESAESGDAAGGASAVKRDSAEGLMPNEVMAPSSMQERAEAAAQAEEAAESDSAAGSAATGERDTGNVLMPDDAESQQSMQEDVKVAAQIEAARESVITAIDAPAGEGAEEGLMPDKALAAVSTTQQAEAPAQDDDVLAPRASSAAAKEQDSEEFVTLDKAQAPVTMPKTVEAAAPDERGAGSDDRIEIIPASAQASSVRLQPDAALPLPSTQGAAEAVTQSITLPLSDAAQVDSHPLELPAHSEPAASVSRKRERPTDLEKLEETEKPGRGSAIRLGNPANMAKNAQGRSGLLAESASWSPGASCQTAAAVAGDHPSDAAEFTHARACVSAVESHEVAQDFGGQAEVSSLGTSASPAFPAAACDAKAASAPGTAPAAALRDVDGAEAMGQARSTAGVVLKESSVGPAQGTHVQDAAPLPQAAESAGCAMGKEASTHAVAARKSASAELLCDEVLPEADFGMPWHELAEAASDGQGRLQPTPDQRANARSRFGQPLPLRHDSGLFAAADAGDPAAAGDAASANALSAHEPVADQVALDSTAMMEEADATLGASSTIAPESAQQDAQPLPQSAEVLDAAPKQDATGQPSIGQLGSACEETSPRIAAALLEAGSRITVRAAKPRRAIMDTHSSAAAPPEAGTGPVSAVPTVEAAVAAEVTEPVKAPTPIKVPQQPDLSSSPASTPSRQGLGSPIRFLSRALSSINPLRRGPEDRTPRTSAPPTPQGLVSSAGSAEPQPERLRPSPLRVDEAGLAAADSAVQSHAVEVSPSPATTADTQSPDSRLPSPARPAQPLGPRSPGSGQDLQTGIERLPRIGGESPADAPAQQAPASPVPSDVAGPAGFAKPESQTSGGIAAAQSGAQEGETAGGLVFADAPAGQQSLTETGASEAAPLQADSRQAAQKEGAEVDSAQEADIPASQRESVQRKQAPAFWKSMSGLFAAPKASAQPSQESSSHDVGPADMVTSVVSGTSAIAEGKQLHSTQPQAQILCEAKPVRQSESPVTAERPQAPSAFDAVSVVGPSAESASQQVAAAAHAGSLTIAAEVPLAPQPMTDATQAGGTTAVHEAPPAVMSESHSAVRMLSEAEEVRSPERMGISRPPMVVTSPFAVAALQAHCGLDAKTAEAIEAAVMSPKRAPIAQRQPATGRGPSPMSAASALEGLQAELAKGDLPASPASPAPADLELLGRPAVKSPTLGRPPLSHATAETAVATLKESRFKAELQKALEECKAELVDARLPAKGANKAPVQALRAGVATSDQPGTASTEAPKMASGAEPADTSQAATGSPSAAKEIRKAELTGTGQAAKGDDKAQSEACMGESGNSGQAAVGAPKAAQEIDQAEPADSGRAVAAAPKAAATRPQPQALEVPQEFAPHASDQLSSRGRLPLQSPSAAGKLQSSGKPAARVATPTPQGRSSTPPLPPHKPPAAVRQSFFALPTAAGSPERPKLGSSDSAHVKSLPQQPGRAQQRTPTQTVADSRSQEKQEPCTSPEASSRRATSEGADTPDVLYASGKQQASGGHRRAASASAADCLGLQTGMSLLDTQNLDELAGTSKQPAFQRAMSMLSTMGSLGTLTCPVVPPTWGSDSEDEHSASSQADSSATSDDSGIISAPLSSTHIVTRASKLASDRDSEQARSAGAALEAGRVQREATASRAGADVRPVFMKALQILTGGRPAAEAEPTEGVLPPAPSHTEPAAAHVVPASASAPAALPEEANSSASSSQAAYNRSTSAVLADERSTAEPKSRRSPGGYRPRRLSAAAKPFIPAAPTPTDRMSAARSLSSVPWQSPDAPWMQKAASPAPTVPQAAAASQDSNAHATASSQPQKPVVSSFEGPSRLAPEAGAGATLARAPVRALDALPGALSNADELASEGAVAGMEAGPSHNPCQRLDFGEAQSSKEDGIWGKLQALRDYHTASEEREAQEIYEDLEAPILATYEVADIVEAVQSMQAPEEIPAALGGAKSGAGPSRFAPAETPLQEQPGLTGQQASLLRWFTGKLADAASKEQLHVQNSVPGQWPTAERESEREAGPSNQGGPSWTGAALKVQQSEELTGMLDGKAAAKSGLLSSYSEMPIVPAVSQGQTGKASTPEGDGLLDTNANMDAAVMATAVSLFPDPLQTANSEMLFNTMDPLSSINSTMNIHDTFEEGQGTMPGKRPALRQQHKRSAPGDLLTTAVRVFDEDAASSCPASAAVPAAARADADSQLAPPLQVEEQQGEAVSSTDKVKGAEQKLGKSRPPGETLGGVLESAKQAVSGAAPGSSLSPALEKLRGNIAQLSATDQFAAHMAIGSLLTTKGRHEDAKGSFEAAVRVNPTSARAFFHLGNVQFALQQYEAAETSFHTALKVLQMPADGSLRPKIHVNLGITVEADGRLLAACHHYQTALDYDPVHYRARKLLGSARYALGDLPAARDALQFALSQCPEYADAQCDLGCTLCAMNKVEEAKEHFEAAIRIMPNHLEALFNLANLQRQCGEFEAAVRSYERVLELSPDSWRGLLNYSVALMGLGRELEAKQALRRAFRLSGYSGKVAEEIEKLRRMAQRGDRQRLGTLMKDISQIVAEEVVDEPPGLKPRRLWGLRSPQRSSSKQMSIGTPGSNVLDTGLLHQLRVVCALRPSALLNLTRNGTLKDLQIQGVNMVAAETIMRRLLPGLPPLRFQHLMRVICHEVLHHIQDDHPTREVDVGMMLALLAAVSRASCEERLAAAYRLLLWQSGCALLPGRLAVAYVRLLKVCFGSKYNKHEDNKWAVEHFEDHTELSQADFAMLFSFPVFAALQQYGQDSASQAST